MHSTIDTMLNRLDPYTKYIPESEIEDFRFQTTGDYGIGATIKKLMTLSYLRAIQKFSC